MFVVNCYRYNTNQYSFNDVLELKKNLKITVFQVFEKVLQIVELPTVNFNQPTITTTTKNDKQIWIKTHENFIGSELHSAELRVWENLNLILTKNRRG